MDIISIIVPVYNVEKYLDRCVKSIVNQTYNNLEIILVDDGSPDNCPQICDSWAEKDSRIKVIHKENGGVSSARNAGIDIAKGKYLGFVDSDDYLEEDMYEKLLKGILDNNSGLCVCGIFSQEEPITFSENETINSEEAAKRMFDSKHYHSFSGWTCNKLFCSEVINKNNIRFDKNIAFCEDVLFVYSYLKCIDSVSLITEPLYTYYYRDDSATVKTNYENESKILSLIDYWLNTEENNEVKNQVIIWSANYWEICLKNYLYDNYDKDAYIHSKQLCKKYFFRIIKSRYYGKKFTLHLIAYLLFPKTTILFKRKR